MSHCLVLWCKNKGQTPGISYFKLTKSRYDTWMEALGRNPNMENLSCNIVVCSDHFTEENKIYTKNKCVRLKADAVPTSKLKKCDGLVENQGYLNRFILPGSIIMSDGWRAYNNIDNIGGGLYDHVVVHQHNFIDPNVYAQTVENMWIRAKKKLRNQFGTSTELFELYLHEFIWRNPFPDDVIFPEFVATTVSIMNSVYIFNIVDILIGNTYDTYRNIRLIYTYIGVALFYVIQLIYFNILIY